MKKLGLMILFIGFGLISIAQAESATEALTNEATYVGGQEAMMKHLAKNIQYPQVAIDKSMQGKVYTAVTINETGKVIDVRILRGVSEELDQEAIRVIKTMPNWNPGTDADGKPVTSRVTLPIHFTLN